MSKEKILNTLKELSLLIDKMEKILFSGRVDWAVLHEIPLNLEVDINGTLNVKIHEEENLIIFKTEIPKDFTEHYHPFTENMIVLSGSCEDDENMYAKGDHIYYEPMKRHYIRKVGEDKLILLVIFTREKF